MSQRGKVDTVAWVTQDYLFIDPEDDPPDFRIDPCNVVSGRLHDKLYLPTFSCEWYWPPSPGALTRYQGGPVQVPFADALAWARSEAALVVVRFSSGDFSAGTKRARGRAIGRQLPRDLDRLPGLIPESRTALGKRARMRAVCMLGFDEEDFFVAQETFEPQLRLNDRLTLHDTWVDCSTQTLKAAFSFLANNRSLAEDFAFAIAIQAATASPVGLANPLNGRSHVSVRCLG